MNIKTMIAAGATLASCALYGSITSANTVGYVNNDLQDNFKAIAPSFISIGQDGYKLSELKVEGVDEAKDEYNVEIQVLTDMGVVTQTYEWWHGGRVPHKVDGWYEDGDTLVDGEDYEVPLTKGQGLWIRAVAGAYIVSSGQVLNENVTIDLDPNFTMIANPFPCKLGLSQVTVDGIDEAKDEYYVEIQVLTDMGVVTQTYEWWHGGRVPHKVDGWYEDGDTLVDGEEYEVELDVGRALWVRTEEGASITFNCPYDLSAK